MRHLSVRLGFAVALAAAAAVFTAAQTAQPQDPAQPPKFRVGANFVRIDAYPLRNGKPVLDLGAGDFEVLEDGVLQKIETFEHVVVRAGGPQETRVEPSSQRESLAAVENPRNRVFVIFLDVPHVSVSVGARDQRAAHPADRSDPQPRRSGCRHDDRDGGVADRVRPQDAGDRRQPSHELAVGDPAYVSERRREEAYLLCYPPLSGEGASESSAREGTDHPQARAGDARGDSGSRALPADRARRAQGDSHRHGRLAAVPSESTR